MLGNIIKPSKDKLTKENSEYQKRKDQELKNYKNDIKVHDLPQSYHYITNTFLKKDIFENTGYENFHEIVYDTINDILMNKGSVKILSMGSGNCDIEISYAKNTPNEVDFTCIELNSTMVNRAKSAIEVNSIEKGRFNFIQEDINKIELPKETYDIVFASHSLHHFVELEHIFDEVNNSMTKDGYFITNDMIGRNGHLIYEDTLKIINLLWDQIPYEFKYNIREKRYFEKRIQHDCSTESFEGIRAEDILPLLNERFEFQVFVPFFCCIQYFIDRDFGFNFDYMKSYDRALLNYIYKLDSNCLKSRLLKPIQMWAVMRKKNYIVEKKSMFNLSPEEILNMKPKYSVYEQNILIPKEVLKLYKLDKDKDFYNLGQIIFFDSLNCNFDNFEVYGLNPPENDYSWTTEEFEIRFKFKEKPQKDLELKIYFLTWQAVEEVDIFSNTQCMAKITEWNNENRYSISIPYECIKDSEFLKIKIKALGATSPAKLDINGDQRVLGIGIREIVIE